MNTEEIRKGAPDGAKFYYDHEGLILYYFKSNFGYHQIKGNIIEFICSDPSLLKPL